MLVPCVECKRPHREEKSCPFCGKASDLRTRLGVLSAVVASSALLTACPASASKYGAPPPPPMAEESASPRVGPPTPGAPTGSPTGAATTK
jgi:hypothetical protein